MQICVFFARDLSKNFQKQAFYLGHLLMKSFFVFQLSQPDTRLESRRIRPGTLSRGVGRASRAQPRRRGDGEFCARTLVECALSRHSRCVSIQPRCKNIISGLLGSEHGFSTLSIFVVNLSAFCLRSALNSIQARRLHPVARHGPLQRVRFAAVKSGWRYIVRHTASDVCE